MATSKELTERLIERVKRDGDKARAEGYVPPDATYTLTNDQGNTLLGVLILADQMLGGDLGGALHTTMMLAIKQDLAAIRALQQEIIAKQAPPYIVAAVDATLAERNSTDKRLS